MQNLIIKLLKLVRRHVNLSIDPHNKPYFGPILAACQVDLYRQSIMQNLINEELRNAGPSYKILEIGSWAGQSTIIWATTCKEVKKGMVFVIDHWQSSKNEPEIMKQAAKDNMIFSLFLYNIEASGVKDYIVILKGSSDIIAEILKPETFDFIYIDGDHAYSQFKKDLLNYMNILKINGILCGDDLELCQSDIDISNAKVQCEEDYILDPITQKRFHPGVTLGIGEILGDVSTKEGFWAMRKVENGWEKVVL